MCLTSVLHLCPVCMCGAGCALHGTYSYGAGNASRDMPLQRFNSCLARHMALHNCGFATFGQGWWCQHHAVQERLFFLHLALLVFAVLHLQPIARVLAARSWGYFLQTAMLTHAYKVGPHRHTNIRWPWVVWEQVLA